MKQYNNKTKYIISFLFLSLLLFTMILPIIQVQADGIVPGEGEKTDITAGKDADGKDIIVISNVDKKEYGAYELSDFTVLMINVATWILGISGSLALLAFIVGGLMFLTSAGNKERVEQAKKILSGAVIGLAIVFFSYTIINFILSKVFGMNDWNEGKTTITTPAADYDGPNGLS